MRNFLLFALVVFIILFGCACMAQRTVKIQIESASEHPGSDITDENFRLRSHKRSMGENPIFGGPASDDAVLYENSEAEEALDQFVRSDEEEDVLDQFVQSDEAVVLHVDESSQVSEENRVAELISSMSIEEKVSQLFILSIDSHSSGSSAGLDAFISETQAGGYILFANNITTVVGTRELTDAISDFSVLSPFICIDEEGGVVSRLRSAGLPEFSPIPAARDIGASGDLDRAYEAGAAIGMMLAEIGVNLNFAPVADVLSNPRNTVIGSRSFGSNPVLVSDMVAAFQAGLRGAGILSSPKHFPGHGNTADDSHFGSAVVSGDITFLLTVDFLPFQRLIFEGAEFVMMGHLLLPEVEPGGFPATLSRFFVSDVLRDFMGFEGVIVTDAMNMGAISLEFSPGDAAVLAVLAGVDMILMPDDFVQARDGLLRAIDDGVISVERIDESLFRIFTVKYNAGLL